MRLTWLPDVLRDAGLAVREVTGWKTRGAESWGPIRGITCHATAGARNGSTVGEIGVLVNGSPSAPPPIAQLYLARDGSWHVVASGRCNHSLVGWAGPNKGHGNSTLLGVEAGNDNRGEPWPAVQLRSYERGVAALARKLGIPASRVAGHKEHQPYPPPPGQTSTKSDPVGIDMARFRAAVARLIDEEDDMTPQELLAHKPDVWDEKGNKPWRAGKSVGVRSRDGMPTVGQWLQWGGEVGHLTHNRVLPALAALQKLLEKLVSQQSGLSEAQVTAAVAAGVAASYDPEALADAIAEKVDRDLDRVAVADALREVLGSLDAAPSAES